MSMCHGPDPADMVRGAYLLLEPHKGLADCAIIFDEKDSELIKRAALILSVQGIAARLIAVKDFSLFEEQDEDYRSKLLRPGLLIFAAVSEDCPWIDKLGAERIQLQDANFIANSVKAVLFPE